MKIVTVARKPCGESSTTANVVVHGCGALNVDGTRVAGPAWTRSTETIEDIRGGRYGTASKDRIETGPREMPSGGRWPANVVLVHPPGCGPECAPTCPTVVLPEAGNGWARNYGEADYRDRQYGGGMFAGGAYLGGSTYCDVGTAARFFKQVRS